MIRNPAAGESKNAVTEPVSEAEILKAEREQILEISDASIMEHGHLALALSGGGVRSATFNLGVLQGLAERGLLTRLDYLSTVSGGGYIGSWLSALTKRKTDVEALDKTVDARTAALKGIAAVEKDLDPRTSAGRGGKEPDPVRWLRRFSNYLTPRTGMLSTDTLAGVATYVRNLLLMQSMLIGVFALALTIPRFIPSLRMLHLFQSPFLCIASLFVAALFINLNLSRQLVEGRRAPPFFARQGYVLGLIVVPLMFAAWLLSLHLLPERPETETDILLRLRNIMLLFGLVWVIAWALVEFVISRFLGGKDAGNYRRSPVVFLWLLVALAAGVVLLWLIRDTLLGHAESAALVWHWTVWGVPSLLSVFGLASILLIGLVGREFAEEEREWWSRLGAWLIAGAACWLALCAASIYGPFAIILAQGWIKGLSLAWIVSTVGGVILGNSTVTGAKDTSKWLNHAAEAAPYIFVAGLLLGLSYGIHVGLIEWFAMPGGNGAQQSTLHSAVEAAGFYPTSFADYAQVLSVIAESCPPTWLAPGLLFALILLLAWRLDINVFAFHMFYRNRLVRAYLGASNTERNAHPFTGFDPDDNLKLTDLPKRPFHIVNTAINLTKVNNLAWQERKAASFVLTRAYCGYELKETGPKEPGKHGYQPTGQYLKSKGWLSLGQALTISGAAVSPNQGYHSSKAVAFLLTVFNLRLGWWMQNPAKLGAWATPGPRLGLRYLLSEVFGLADENSGFVYLSDGGHFENLGIYELVRRKCRFIIAIDAGMDPKFGFEDLGNAVRKCQVDFGVRIDIDTKASVPAQGTGRSLYHCGVGRIHYEETDPGAISGYLLYIKPSLTGNEPIDIMQYASVHPEFPHQSTTDQWFDESQFEAYRKLGYYIATTVLEKEAVEEKPGEARSLLDLFVDLGRRWYRPSARVEANFTKHAQRLMLLQNTMREQKVLSFLDGQIFPEWDYLMHGGRPEVDTSLWLPETEEELRAGFYFCLNLLELMQDVYLDLNLDEEWQHPDNRGWMNLFKHLAWAGMLRATYAVVRSNFGARFQRFSDVRLDLPEGRIEIVKAVEHNAASGTALKEWADEHVKEGNINFVEAEGICQLENTAPAAGTNASAFDMLHVIGLIIPELRRGKAKPLGPNAEAQLTFPVGVALTRGKTIVWFRIQDHLRNMGLGRKALESLYRKGAGYDMLEIDRNSPDAKRVEDLFYSIKGRRP